MADVAERLIRMNPSACDEYDKDGLTPLHHAARGNFVKIIQLLLDAGAGKDVLLNLGLLTCSID